MSGKAIGATIVAIGVISAGGYYGVKGYADHQARQKIAEVQDNISDIGSIDYDSVTTRLFDQSVDVNDITFTFHRTRDIVEIDRLSIHEFDNENEVPEFGKISAHGITIPFENLDSEQQEVLRSLGYDALSLSTEIDYRAEPNQGNIELSITHLVKDVGEISGEFNFGNVIFADGEIFESPNLAINSARITYRDNSLIPRIYQFGANRENTSVDAFKEQLVGSLDMLTMESPHNPVMTELASALETFINDPQQLSVSLRPAEPVVMGQLMFTPPDRIPEILGIEIAANR